MWYLACLFAALVAAASAGFVQTETIVTSESDLRKALFANYDKLVRPVKDPSKTVTLRASISPLAIKEVDEKKQIIVIDSWVLLKWQDEAFSWDPELNSNISVLRIPSSEVWKPDVALYTATDEDALFPNSPTQVLIYPNSDVLWVPMFSVRSRCAISRRSDKSTLVCPVKFGSWTYSGPLLDIQLYTPEVDLSNFQDINPDWKLQGVDATREDKYYPCCPEPYPSITFNVTLKRRDSMRNTNKNEVWSSL